MDIVTNGKKLRQLRGDTPAQTVADSVGISVSALLMYERGERNPRDDIKEHLANYYGTTIGALFYAEDIAKSDIMNDVEANKEAYGAHNY